MRRELLERWNWMNLHENELYAKGYQLIAGIDEAGRGPLAGPVVAASVILPRYKKIFGLDDSKKLSEKERQSLYDQIIDTSISFSVKEVGHEEIDRINILQATKKAMFLAVEGLWQKPEFLLIDHLTLPSLSLPQQGITGGDGLSNSIAAASILAKVTRDRLMMAYHTEYPQYGFDRHKGYPTKGHYGALEKYGPCPIHRRTFRGVGKSPLVPLSKGGLQGDS